MPSTLLSVKEPQDIYILGNACTLTDEECTQMGITDDYSTISFYAGKTEVAHIETVGFLYIFTEAQFKAAKDKIVKDEMYMEHAGLEYETGLPARGAYVDDYAVILPNFVGDIQVSMYDKVKDVCYMNNYDVTKDCYICEHRDEEYDREEDREYGDVEELIRLPEGTIAIQGPIYKTIDHFNKATYLETAPNLDTVEEIYAVLDKYDEHHSVTSDFCDPYVYKPTFIGYLLGLSNPKINSIGNKFATIHKNGGTYADKDKGETYNYLRPIFSTDFCKELKEIGINFNLLLSEFIVKSDVYLIKFNKWYKPLTRPLDIDDK